MKRFFIAAILLAFTTVAFAQTQPPRDIADRVFKMVEGTMFEDCRLVSSLLRENTSQYDFAYCGGINDTLMVANQTLTERALANYGFSKALPRWQYGSFNYNPGYMMGFRSARYHVVVVLAIIRDGGRQATAVMVVFNRR
jgi:hypothetical protein